LDLIYSIYNPLSHTASSHLLVNYLTARLKHSSVESMGGAFRGRISYEIITC